MTATDQKIISPVNTEERKNLDIRTGDTVRVWQKIEERDGNIRLQPFEGIVLARKHGTEAGATFTVRRTVGGYGVEKIFPLYSPMIDRIEITKRAKVRSSKLYHIRDKAARQIKRQMRRMKQVAISTESDIEAKEKAEQEAAEAKEQQEDVTENNETQEEEVEPQESNSQESQEEEAEEPADDADEARKEE